jgi:hypothetical protein
MVALHVFLPQLVLRHVRMVHEPLMLYLETKKRSMFFGNAILNQGAYASFSQKINLEIAKNLGKNIRMYISKLYVLMHSLGKRQFCGLCKIDKKHAAKRLTLVPNFFIFI